MSFKNLENVLLRLFSMPLKDQVEVEVDHQEKILILSVPIYRANGELSPSIRSYVEKRRGLIFLPHATSFDCIEPDQVILTQKVPFEAEIPTTTRDQFIAFWKMAKGCHEMLVEIRVEEMVSEFQLFDPDLEG